MGSRPSPPPLPSAITTTQCQHPPKSRHLHQRRRRHRLRRRRRRRSSNSGNHSNSLRLLQREHRATASRDFREGGQASGRASTRAGWRERAREASLPPPGRFRSSTSTRRRLLGHALPQARHRPPAEGSRTHRGECLWELVALTPTQRTDL